MRYQIAEPDRVVEASFSSAEDDLSLASIRIEASLDTDWRDLRYVDVVVPPALTGQPRAITPQVSHPGLWTFVLHHESGILRATPRFVDGGGAFTPIPGMAEKPQRGSSWVFTLRDIRVAEGDGPVEIEIVEVPEPERDAPVPLQVVKTLPPLRIDFFRVAGTGAAAGAVVDSTTPVSLEWATSGATEVMLYGPDGREPITLRDADDTELDPLDPKVLDHVHELGEVATTGTYTLVARAPGEHVTAQTTVVVSNQVVARRLTVSGEVVADLEVEGRLDVAELASLSDRTAIHFVGDLVIPGTLTTPGLVVRTAVVGDLDVSDDAVLRVDQLRPPSEVPGDDAGSDGDEGDEGEAADPPTAITFEEGLVHRGVLAPRRPQLGVHPPPVLEVDAVVSPLVVGPWRPQQGLARQHDSAGLIIGNWRLEAKRDTFVLVRPADPANLVDRGVERSNDTRHTFDRNERWREMPS